MESIIEQYRLTPFVLLAFVIDLPSHFLLIISHRLIQYAYTSMIIP